MQAKSNRRTSTFSKTSKESHAGNVIEMIKDRTKLEQMQDLIDMKLEPVWATALYKDYQIVKIIGVGSFGVVAKA